MSLPIGSQQITADGVIGSSGGKIRLYSIIVHSGGTAGVATLHDGTTTGGTELDQINGTISVSKRVSYPGGLLFNSGLYIDIDANVVYVTAIYEQEHA